MKAIKEAATYCSSAARRIHERHGFIPLRELSAALNVEVVFRPLLVEGMVAAPKFDRLDSSESSWKVLLNSERFPDGERQYKEESKGVQMEPRLRFTLAHEIAHTMSFRTFENGVELKESSAVEKSGKEQISALEKESNYLAPLLLVPDKALAGELARIQGELSPEAVKRIASSFGVSIDVIISRLARLRQYDPQSLRNQPILRNLALLTAEKSNESQRVILPFPLFYNYDDNLVPLFIERLIKGERVTLDSLEEQDLELTLVSDDRDVNVFEINFSDGLFGFQGKLRFQLAKLTESSKRRSIIVVSKVQ